MANDKLTTAGLRGKALKKANDIEKTAERCRFNVLFRDDFCRCLAIVRECDEVLTYADNAARVEELNKYLESLGD